jgi:hypothetical protein
MSGREGIIGYDISFLSEKRYSFFSVMAGEA